MVASVLVIASMNGIANAGYYKVQGNLDCKVHWVPVLQDSAEAATSITNPSSDWDGVRSKTTAYAYNSDGDYNSNSISFWCCSRRKLV